MTTAGPVGRALGLAQKIYDLADYVRHRSWIKLKFQLNRIRHRLAVGRSPRTILVVRLASIGDVIRASAIVRELKRRYPDAAIDFLTTDPARAMIARNPALRATYTLGDLARLGDYDWMINLQNRDPAEGFLRGSGLTYREIVRNLSTRAGIRFISGRRLNGGRETTPTNVLYCVSEVEELFLTALLPYDRARYPVTEVFLDPSARAASAARFPLPGDRPVLGLFLGSESVGCGYDEGFRTYSLAYFEDLVRCFYERFTIVVIGLSRVRNADEQRQYRDLLSRYPRVIDLVDKTSLDELAEVVSRFRVLITCDSSPVHLAMASQVPVVVLYANNATFALAPCLEGDRYVALNAEPPCFQFSWRWKFFCPTCRDPRTRAYYCRPTVFTFGVDQIPVSEIERAVERVIGRTPVPALDRSGAHASAGEPVNER